MSIDCKAIGALAAAGIAVAGTPIVESAAVAPPAPVPAIAFGTFGTAITIGSAADLLGPAAHVAPWNLPTASYPHFWPWPPRRLTSLAVSVTPGKGSPQPTPQACDSLLVTVDGLDFPNSLDSDELDFYNSADQLVDYFHPSYGTSQSKRCVWMPK